MKQVGRVCWLGVSAIALWLISSVAEAREIPLTLTETPSGLAQVKQSELTEITNVEIQETAEGVILELVTAGELSVSETTIQGNTAIAQISNAVLRLAEGEDFFAIDPVEGITFISVTPLANNRVEIAIAQSTRCQQSRTSLFHFLLLVCGIT